ncbi:branched-chain amino acid ABC transporter permease [Rhodopseudomonas sp. AAP120]|uniref:branched-chain amino acid ABC transporter permease n=1 Tax=Rhodopseudomonas sp. AAP120 TaxID=1523430 RepID=UPI0006B9704E|nr:branched-chain amino acid ABC transporter permease [Rhodopseudomonas sp. AAP120]KPF96381.1 branched-chain amino acid ABC transporter permease [Rhodopseudomonas sp. AAP120]
MITQQIINGLMLGSIYVLVGVSFTLAIGILNFLNFSIPGLFMIGGMVSWVLLAKGWHWAFAIGGALAAAALVSLAVELLSYRRTRGADPEVPLVSSLGFLVLLENLALVGVGSDQQTFPSLLGDFNFRIGGLVIGAAQAISLVLTFALVVGLSFMLGKTNLGRQIRAIAESRSTAVLLGVDVGRLVPKIFVLTALFTALGGVMFALSYLQVSPFMGEGVGFKGVAAMIIGGMGSVWGAVIGGLIIGLIEVGSISAFGADTVNIAVYGSLLLLLILRPHGLFGKPAIREKL